jgi:hypothetical protein
MDSFLIIFGAMILVFGLGAFAGLMGGGKFALNYLMVKMSKNKKILLFVDTPTGRKSYVGIIDGGITEGVIKWTYMGDEKITEILAKNVGRFYGVNFMSLNLESPLVAYDLTILGEKPASAIDNKTYNNILKRAMTGQFFDFVEEMIKKITIGLIASVLVIILCIVILIKLGSVTQAIAMLNVI